MTGPETQLGEVRWGKYRLLRELGRGSAGAVYEAEHTWTERVVALKVLALEADAEHDAILREIRASARLVHTNAITLIDAETTSSNAIFLVSELLRGETLQARIARGRLSIDEAADVLLPVMEALSAAHSADIVHRDVKPSNIFLAKIADTIVPKLGDFAIGALFATTRHERSRGYLAPEQLRDAEPIDSRADVWAIAVTWLECLTGQRPFATSSADVPERGDRLVERFGDLSRIAPRAFVEIMARALEPDRRYRWPTIHEMRRAIATVLGRESEPTDLVEPISVDLVLGEEPTPSTPIALDDDRLTERPPPRVAESFAMTPSPHGSVHALIAHGLPAVRFGLVPVAASFHDPTIGDTLGRVLGVPVVVLRFGGYDELFAALRARRVEIAWMAPAPFVRAAAARLVNGCLVSVRGGASSYVSVLLAHGRRVHALEKRFVRKRRAAWVDPWSAAGYLMPRRVLRSRGIDPDLELREQLMVGSYPAVVDSIRSGAADLGGVFGWRRNDGGVWHLGSDHDELVALAVSDPIPSDVMAVHAQLPKPIAKAITRPLAGLDPLHVDARSLLAAVGAEQLGPFDPQRYLSIAAALDDEERGRALGAGI